MKYQDGDVSSKEHLPSSCVTLALCLFRMPLGCPRSPEGAPMDVKSSAVFVFAAWPPHSDVVRWFSDCVAFLRARISFMQRYSLGKGFCRCLQQRLMYVYSLRISKWLNQSWWQFCDNSDYLDNYSEIHVRITFQPFSLSLGVNPTKMETKQKSLDWFNLSPV